MSKNSLSFFKKVQCLIAVLYCTLRNWKIVKILLIYEIPQLFLNDSLLLNTLSRTLWPKRNRIARSLPLEQRIIEACNTLGPIFIKFGQIVSTRVDMLPEEVASALEKLQDEVPPFPTREAEKLIEANIKGPIKKIFKSFERTAIGSASLAQVHKATLRNNKKVIIKLLRPGIKKKIQRNLHTLFQFARLIDIYHPNGKIIRATEVIEDYEISIHHEIDLLIEAANCSHMYRNTLNNEVTKIPKILWPYCFKNMLVAEYMPGIKVYRYIQKSNPTQKKQVAMHILMLFLDQTFKYNFFHADMHPGNIIIDHKKPKKPMVQLIDFGIVGSLSKSDQYYIAKNLIAFFNRDYEAIINLHIESGWIPDMANKQTIMNQLRAIGEPLYAKPLKEISFARVLGQLLQIARQYRMVVQPQLLLLQKTIFNVEGLIRQLDPELNLWENAKPYVEKWMKEQYSIPKNLYEIIKKSPDFIQNLSRYTPKHKNLINQTSKTKQALQRTNNQALYLTIGFLAGIITTYYFLMVL